VRLLATSREGLNLPGETIFRVPPLATADPRHLPPLETLRQVEAVRLFAERAGAVKPDFSVTPTNAPALAAIASRLDGIPLALELAAARVRVLTVEEIAERLDDRFRLLTGGARTAPPRQQTLRGRRRSSVASRCSSAAGRWRRRRRCAREMGSKFRRCSTS
jgi:predicted ATPase